MKLRRIFAPAICLVALLAYAAAVGAASRKETLDAQLFDALRDADFKAVKAAISGGANPNARDEVGLSALMAAATYAGVDSVELLLAKGADPNAKSRFEVTALMLAIGDVRKVRVLLLKGAEVNAKSKQGHTALSIAAAREGSLEVVKELLDHGADLNIGNCLGSAARIGDLPMVKYLVEKGADLNNRNSVAGPPPATEKRASERAKAEATMPISPILGFPISIGHSPLMYAAQARNLEVVRFLLAKGADINLKNEVAGGATALLLAAQLGDPETVSVLLEKGADVNLRHASGYTALMYAAVSESTDAEMIKALLARGAEINAHAKDGETALSLARRKGNTAIVRLLEQAVARR